MHRYDQDINMYFELKGTPDSSRESYLRRMNAFIKFIEMQNQCIEDITERDIQQYILFLKRERGLSAGTINNYISGIGFFTLTFLTKTGMQRKSLG
jgi:integrase/recombinase XerD